MVVWLFFFFFKAARFSLEKDLCFDYKKKKKMLIHDLWIKKIPGKFSLFLYNAAVHVNHIIWVCSKEYVSHHLVKPADSDGFVTNY